MSLRGTPLWKPFQATNRSGKGRGMYVVFDTVISSLSIGIVVTESSPGWLSNDTKGMHVKACPPPHLSCISSISIVLVSSIPE